MDTSDNVKDLIQKFSAHSISTAESPEKDGKKEKIRTLGSFTRKQTTAAQVAINKIIQMPREVDKQKVTHHVECSSAGDHLRHSFADKEKESISPETKFPKADGLCILPTHVADRPTSTLPSSKNIKTSRKRPRFLPKPRKSSRFYSRGIEKNVSTMVDGLGTDVKTISDTGNTISTLPSSKTRESVKTTSQEEHKIFPKPCYDKPLGGNLDISTMHLITIITSIEKLLEMKEFDEQLRNPLAKQFPNFTDDLQKRKSDLVKVDHGIVIAGETSAGKSTLINKIIGKRIFKGRTDESTATICKIRNSDTVSVEWAMKTIEKEEVVTKQKHIINEEDNVREMRRILKSLSEDKDVMYVDISLPVSLLKGNTIIVDTPGIGGSRELQGKLMNYLPNAVSFVFVVNVASAGGMQKDRLPIILKAILELKGKNEMPCFDEKEVIFVTNKWDSVKQAESDTSDEEDEIETTWKKIKLEIKKIWPLVQTSNIFRMSLTKVKKNEQNCSVEEFQKFERTLQKVVEKSKNARMRIHLSYLERFVRCIIRGIRSKLNLVTQTDATHTEMIKRHRASIAEMKRKCEEVNLTLTEDLESTIDHLVDLFYEKMCNEKEKDMILNPIGEPKIIDVRHFVEDQVKERIETYKIKWYQSKEVTECFQAFAHKLETFSNDVQCQLNEIDFDLLGGEEQESSNIPFVVGAVASSPIWIPLVAVGVALTVAGAAIAILLSPLYAPAMLLLSSKENRKQKIDAEYELIKESIRSTIRNELLEYIGAHFLKAIEHTVEFVIRGEIASIEETIDHLSRNKKSSEEKYHLFKTLERKVEEISKRLQEMRRELD